MMRRNSSIVATVLVALSVLVASHVILLLLHSTAASTTRRNRRIRFIGATTATTLNHTPEPEQQRTAPAVPVVDVVETEAILEVAHYDFDATSTPTMEGSATEEATLAPFESVDAADQLPSAMTDIDAESEPFPPPLYGYNSLEEMNDRSSRFPSIQERVYAYMSNWYLPPCPMTSELEESRESTPSGDGFVHYRYASPSSSILDDDSSNHQLLVREIESTASVEQGKLPNAFILDSNSTLGKLHFLNRDKMKPEHCDSEYCADMLEHWLPAVDRVFGANSSPPLPIMFQFSDEELSRANSIATHRLVKYPNLPHLKKSRLSLLRPRDVEHSQSCNPHPKKLLTTVAQDESVPEHLHPIIYKLKTNRHYGMIGSIPSQDVAWSDKKNQAIFRGTLTGLLPTGSRFSLSTRNSKSPMLSDKDAQEKCLELDRCRLVYQVNRLYADTSESVVVTPPLVDAKLVHPQLQHVDIPQEIYNVSIFGNRMTKEDLMRYKAIVLLEGNDAGTGFKWGLFSNSVVMTTAPLNFTSWAMEELLEPWVHYIPLDPHNFAKDVHDKMQWVLDHDDEAKQIARRGSLWIRDLLVHPDAKRDDEDITDDMVRRYMSHFIHDDSLEPSFDMLEANAMVDEE